MGELLCYHVPTAAHDTLCVVPRHTQYNATQRSTAHPTHTTHTSPCPPPPREYRIPVKGVVHPGRNSLELVFHSAITESAHRAGAYPYKVPSMQGPGMLPNYNFLRKPACDFGWDWYVDMLVVCGADMVSMLHGVGMWFCIAVTHDTPWFCVPNTHSVPHSSPDQKHTVYPTLLLHRGPAFAGAGVFGTIKVVGYTLPYISSMHAGYLPVLTACVDCLC